MIIGKPVWPHIQFWAQKNSIAAEYHEIVRSLGVELVELGTVTNAVDKCKTWSPKLRQGACTLIYNTLQQTWAVSVGPEAAGSSDLAALVCRVATVVDPRGHNEKLQALKSRLETHLEKTQSQLALSQLRALVQVDRASNLEEVSVALNKCKKWRSHQTWRTSWSLSTVRLCHTLSNR